MTTDEKQEVFTISEQSYGVDILRYGQVIASRDLDGSLRFNYHTWISRHEYEEFIACFELMKEKTKDFDKKYLQSLIEIEENRIVKSKEDLNKYKSLLSNLENSDV